MLYHYTSCSAFYNMMESESIYLCDVQKSNDFMELKHYKGKFAGIGCFGEYWEAISFVLNNESRLVDIFFK